jgi:hypothetical protein
MRKFTRKSITKVIKKLEEQAQIKENRTRGSMQAMIVQHVERRL